MEQESIKISKLVSEQKDEKVKVLPKDYRPVLGMIDTQKAICMVHEVFEHELQKALDLVKVACPRFIKVDKGLQDDLAGTQTPVSFVLKDGSYVEVVHSLAKWKRFTLGRLGVEKGKGLLTVMDAFRKDEFLSPIHSVYVDQWDWEKVISEDDRDLEYLKSTVESIYNAMKISQQRVLQKFSSLLPVLPEKIHFIHSEDLESFYPSLSPKDREHKIAEELGAVFLIGIGHPLKSGLPHDLRAADYDDWSTSTVFGKRGLNGDIIVWDPVRKSSLELSSMGIRVDKDALERQLVFSGLADRKGLEFHQGVLKGSLPLTVGGGIGRSRFAMLLLRKAHIGEVQSSVWPEDVEKECAEQGVFLL